MEENPNGLTGKLQLICQRHHKSPSGVFYFSFLVPHLLYVHLPDYPSFNIYCKFFRWNKSVVHLTPRLPCYLRKKNPIFHLPLLCLQPLVLRQGTPSYGTGVRRHAESQRHMDVFPSGKRTAGPWLLCWVLSVQVCLCNLLHSGFLHALRENYLYPQLQKQLLGKQYSRSFQ